MRQGETPMLPHFTYVGHHKRAIEHWKRTFSSLSVYENELLKIQGTLEEIVVHKLSLAYNIINAPCAVDEVGLYIDGVGKLPGGYLDHFMKLNPDKFYTLAKMGNGTFEFECIVGYHDGENISLFSHSIFGHMVPPNMKNGIESIFEIDGTTMDTMSEDEAYYTSPRVIAMNQLKRELVTQKLTNKFSF